MNTLIHAHQIINGSPIPTFIIDRNHRVTHWNKACEVLTGLSGAEVIGTSNQWMAFYDRQCPLLADLVVDETEESRILEHLEGKTRKSQLIEGAYEGEAYRMTIGAGGKWLFFTAAPLRDSSDQIAGAIQTLQDISERKIAVEREHALNLKLEQSVTELNNSLELLQKTQHQLVQTAKMAALGQLVAGVAHEINTPIGIGVTAASLLEEKTVECTRLFDSQTMKRSDLEGYFRVAKDSSEMILSNLRRASDLIQRFKQVAVDQTCEDRKDINLRECLENLIMSLQPMLKKGSHIVSLKCREDLVLQSYAGALGQIIPILVLNSLNHGFEEMRNGRISINILEQEDTITICYNDNGKGVPPEHLERIFDPFFTTQRNKGGTGLGLHILYNIVAQTLGGHIECESTPGQGITYRIEFPRISPPSRNTFFNASIVT